MSAQQIDDLLVSYKDLSDLGCKILKKQGTPLEIAQQVVTGILSNEINGYESHGLLRLLEYVSLINNGHIIPLNHPQLSKKNKYVTEVNGQKCFGILSAKATAKALILKKAVRSI